MSHPVRTVDRRARSSARPVTSRQPLPPTWVLKMALAVTGTVFVAFAVFHLFGNLKVFLGKDELNHYAFWLQRDLLAPLVPEGWFVWIFRAVLTLCLVVHVGAAVVVRGRARRARGPYPRRRLRGVRAFQARSMMVTGTVLLLFVVFHVLDLTVGAAPVASDRFEHGNAYDNLVHSFERPVVALFYVAAMVVLLLHVAHGLWSVVNDLGGTGRRLRAVAAALAGVVGLALLLGNALIPLAVLTGAVS